MTPFLLPLLCDPETHEPLSLSEEKRDADGNVLSGKLSTPSGRSYPIVEGIPRFLPGASLQASVHSFGEEWNHFNFTAFKPMWLNHTVANTFGSTEAFRSQVIVDAGGGSGAQTLWMLESGARHVIMLELSHSVDDVVKRNLAPSGFKNFDVVQCSIDAPPLRARSVQGLVICHNVIQHTPSVERTARALYELVAPGGEFVFNCYPKNDDTPLRWIRFHVIYVPLRAVLRRMPFGVPPGLFARPRSRTTPACRGNRARKERAVRPGGCPWREWRKPPETPAEALRLDPAEYVRRLRSTYLPAPCRG